MSENAKKLYMIGNAHIDPVWLWPWTEGFHEVKATYHSALDRIKEYNDFVFTASSAAYYEWVEHNDPDMFAEIKQRVLEGRWKLAGGWWIQPDCNIPCGESYVRQALYAQRYFQDKFGSVPTFGYNVDSFGHNGMLPQILLKSGLTDYVFMRPGPSEKEIPSSLFWWESDDGSRVLAYRIPHSYASWGDDLDDTVRACAREFYPPMDVGMCFYGVGNHGGGPTKTNIECIEQLQLVSDLPDLEFSGPDAYFEFVRDQKWSIPIVHDDLQHHASGCYAAHSGVKFWNRKAENSLIAAEKWSVIANQVTGLPYPTDFTRAWKNVLFNQFHDILAGTSIESAYDDVRNFYGEAIAIAGRNINSALQAIAWNIHINNEPQMQPIVIFNPHAWVCRVPVEIEINKPPNALVLLNDQGKNIPFQFIQSASAAPWRTRICFIADLPSLGYRVFRLLPGKGHDKTMPIAVQDLEIKNSYITFRVDRDTGCISRILANRDNIELLADHAGKPVVFDDQSDTWSHNVFRYDSEIGSFTPTDIRIIEQGPVRATIRVVSVYNHSRLVQSFTMYDELGFIEVTVFVDWQEQNKLLKLKFPFRISATHTTYEIPYGHIERPANGDENPGQSWVDVTGISPRERIPFGISILNDGKYSFDSRSQDIADVHEISLTVLRSPAYAHHLPMELDPKGLYKFIDQGQQTFKYYLYPHSGSWASANTIQLAAEINQPPFAILGISHEDGKFPPVNSFISVDSEHVVLSVLKQSEDQTGFILRCYETAGKSGQVNIALPLWNRTLHSHFSPCEIKTFNIPFDPTEEVKEVNLIEWDIV